MDVDEATMPGIITLRDFGAKNTEASVEVTPYALVLPIATSGTQTDTSTILPV
jgi:hypothetical protein